MSYVVLILIPIIICIAAFVVFNKDVLSPSFITCTSFFVSILCACIGLLDWNYDKDLSLQTIAIFLLGLASFVLGGFAVKLLENDKTKKITSKNSLKLTHIPRSVLFILLFFIIITSILLFFEIKKYCLAYGFKSESFTKLLSFYRSKTGLFNASAYNSSIQINFIIKQMQKASNAINIITFVYGINLFFNNKLKKIKNNNIIDYILIGLIIIFGLFQTIMFNGGRSIIFHFALAYLGLFAFYYIHIFEFIINKKIITSGIAVVLFLIVSFYLLLPLVGRNTKHNPITYISFSLGTSIPSLDLYLETINDKSEYFGEETFSGIYYTLNKLGLIYYSKAQSHEWYAFAEDGSLSSNTFTSFRSYYKDFGIFGLIILQMIFGFFIHFLYTIIKNNKWEFLIIVFFYYFYILFEQVRDEQFYSLINISTIANVFLLALVYYSLIFIQKRGKQNDKIKKQN